jgi:hypothetical protein
MTPTEAAHIAKRDAKARLSEIARVTRHHGDVR